MATVKLLVNGYADEKNSRASSSVVFIEDKNIKVIIDPGIDQLALNDSLHKNSIKKEQIDYVVITHYHPDHTALVGQFTNAKIIDRDEISTFQGNFAKHAGFVPSTDIKIIPTAGHSQAHCSILTNDDKLGHILIAGDLFWRWDDEQCKNDTQGLINRIDPYALDQQQLIINRQKILQLADYIIPGHGDLIKVEK